MMIPTGNYTFSFTDNASFVYKVNSSDGFVNSRTSCVNVSGDGGGTVECGDQNTDGVPDTPTYIFVTFTTCFILIFLVGVLGNGLVIAVIALCRTMKSSVNLYLLNLCMADILVIAVCMPTALADIYTKDVWYFGGAMCKIVPFLENTVANASILTILAISIERYWAVCYPLKGIDHRAIQIWMIVISIWLISAIASVPFLYISFLKSSHFHDGTPIVVCRTPIVKLWQQVYVILLDVLFFLAPCLCLFLLNCHLCCVLRRSLDYISSQMSLQDRKQQQHQVINILASIVFIFFLCHLPFRVAVLWLVFEDKEYIYSLGLETYLNILYSTRIMFYLNHALNPVLYNFFSTKFRLALRGLCMRARSSTQTTALSLSFVNDRHLQNFHLPVQHSEAVALRNQRRVKEHSSWTRSQRTLTSSTVSQASTKRNNFFPAYKMVDTRPKSNEATSSPDKEFDVKIQLENKSVAIKIKSK